MTVASGLGAADAVVVGAGFAGVMTAAELVRRGFGRVVVVEREAVPASHGSGRNAAIARRLAEHPAVTGLAARSLVLMGDVVGPAGEPVLKRTGGVLLGSRVQLDRLLDAIPDTTPEARALRAETRVVANDALAAAWPWLGETGFDAGIATANCGVVDIHGLVSNGLAVLSGQLHLKSDAIAIETDSHGAVSAVIAGGTRIPTRLVVNAAGFRANRLARLAGARPLPFNPVRRHLFTTAPNDAIAKGAPWFWDVGRGFYLRREGAGVLLCACDATAWPEDGPDDPPRDPAAREWAAARFTDALPALASLEIRHDWAGLRILTPDQAFVIGPDPDVTGFFWVAGLGGHGMTTACGVGELAADLIVGAAVPDLFRTAFDPARFRLAAADPQGS